MKRLLALIILLHCMVLNAPGLLFASGTIEEEVIYSRILKREQPIEIYLPAGYAASSKKYPVLYVLDGQYYFYYGVAFQQTSEWRHKSPQYIVVGIPTRDKQQRSLDFETAAGAVRYRSFLEQELLPFVAKNYRASEDRMIFGWQQAGGLVTQILLKYPHLFSAYFVASGATADSSDFDLLIREGMKHDRFFYFAHAESETWALRAFSGFAALLEKHAPEKIRWKHEAFDDEDHWSTPHRTIYRGLTEYYRDYQPLSFSSLEAFEEAGGIPALVDHYRKRGEKYAVSPSIHSSTVFRLLSLAMRSDNYSLFDEIMGHFSGDVAGLYPVRWQYRYGMFYLQHHQPEKALAVLEKAIEDYPTAASLYDGVGDVYRQLGELEKAAAAYRKAVEFSQQNQDDQTEGYRQKLEALSAEKK